MKILHFSAYLVTVALTFCSVGSSAEVATQTSFSQNKSDPIEITADSLRLDSKGRLFTYVGDVKVVQGDMTLTCEKLDGLYDENNQIIQLDAFRDVEIVKGKNVQTKSEKAVYIAKTETVTLTENPRILQGKSMLIADKVLLYLDTEKTVAQGRVQMKIINDGSSETKALVKDSKKENP